MFEPKTYRLWVKDSSLVSFTVMEKETDLYILARSDLSIEALDAVLKYRASIESYIKHHPMFLTSLEPLVPDDDAPEIVKQMSQAAIEAGVGPMAAVAGAIAECVGRDLLSCSPEVIVENGGDLFIKSSQKRLVGIYAGNSPFTGTIALEIEPDDTPLGICASSGTVGHSLSFGKSDAVIVLSPSTALADAAATRIANIIVESSDISHGIELARDISGVQGVVIIENDNMGLWGKVKLRPSSP